MAFGLAQRLISVGLVPPLAVELSRQIQTGNYNWKRLSGASMVPQLAKYVADGLQYLDLDPRKAMELGLTEAQVAVLLGDVVQFGGAPAALLGDIADAFALGGNASQTTNNQVNPDGFGGGGPAAIVGSPTYNSAYATLSGANYVQTQVQERYQYTLLAAVRIRNSAPNKAVTIADTYATDLNIDAGTTKFGTYFTMAQTTSTDPPGTLSVRIGVGLPDPTTPIIGFMNPTLSIADVTAWRIVGVVCYGITSKVVDLTANTSSAIANAPAGYRRFPAYTNKYRIGSDYSAFANGQIDVAAWQHYDRALTDVELNTVASKLRTDYATLGITL